MKTGFVYSLILYLIVSCLISCSEMGNSSGSGSTQKANIVNHTNFDASLIPDSYIAQIKALDVYFEHASVGQNIVSGLNALASSSPARYGVAGTSWGTAAVDSSVTNWYSSNNGFGDNARGNPGFTAKVNGFNANMRTSGFAAQIKAASFKFCYIDNDYLSGYADAAAAFNYVKGVMESLESAYINVAFFWWTMPITSAGDFNRDAFNALVRNYCKTNNKYLLDLADIECYSPSGLKQTDVNGYEYLYSGYTADGGHLIEAGYVRAANAYWVMLAKICGWNG